MDADIKDIVYHLEISMSRQEYADFVSSFNLMYAQFVTDNKKAELIAPILALKDKIVMAIEG